MDKVREYINYRYQNWHDYALYQAKANGFESYADDLLNDIIVDLLQKPFFKLEKMYNKKTTKIINNAPTTELDKFVLKMIKLNARSKTAPFRKNTLGNKIISRKNNQITAAIHCPLNGTDVEANGYDIELDNRLTRMHEMNINRLIKNKFNNNTIQDYCRFFIRGQTPTTEVEAERAKQIQKFLTSKKTLLDDNS